MRDTIKNPREKLRDLRSSKIRIRNIAIPLALFAMLVALALPGGWVGGPAGPSDGWSGGGTAGDGQGGSGSAGASGLASSGGAGSSVNGQSDDFYLLTTQVAPNVVIALDTSGSMQHIEWHDAFDPDAASYGCTAFDNSQNYYGSDFSASETYCSNTRTIYKPAGSTTRYTGRYLNWYFSDAADPYMTEINTGVAATAGCNNGATNYDHKYRRSRFDAARQVILDLMCFAEPKGIRIGLAEFREAADVDNNDPNGGYVAVEIAAASPAQTTAVRTFVDAATPGGNTPLAETLFQMYTYLMPRNSTDMPKGQDAATDFPIYRYNLSGAFTSTSSNWPADPLQYACQRSFVIVVTDGISTRDDFDSDPNDTAQGFDNFSQLIGDYNNDSETEDIGSNEGTRYLDDVALFMATNDYRPDLAGTQLVDTYTVGFATEADANTLLQKTADVGNGAFYFSRTGDDLASALVAAVNTIIEESHSFTAASVPSTRSTDGGHFYQSFFFPRAASAEWQGHLRAWTFTPDGSVLDKFGQCALVDVDPGECNSGVFLSSATEHWDAADEIPSPANRKLYTSVVLSGNVTLADFDQGLTAEDLDLTPFASPPAPAPNSASYPLVGSTATNAEGLADEIVEHARGCEFGTGVAVDVVNPQACAAQATPLGDIFHSEPVAVRKPRRMAGDPSSQAFQLAYANRTRVLYAGANDGFLHAFHAGAVDSNAPYTSYLAGSGTELFGFMPWESRLEIKHRAIDDPVTRHYYVDGAPQVADIWFQSADDDATKSVDEWGTLLVGGLRQGGRTYYALDVTNPDGFPGAAPLGRAYPGYVWEFPLETDPNDPNDPASYLPYMGETWGQPIITRIKVENTLDPNVWHERWVVIVSAGYAQSGNPNDALYDLSATEGRAILVLDAKTGTVLAEKKVDLVATDDRQYMEFAFASTPAVYDTDNDGFADVIYAPDLGGQIFKWVIRAPAKLNDASQPSWAFKRFFEAPSGPVQDGTTRYKNMFFPPAASFVGSSLWLAIGTGERDEASYIGDTTTLNENNWFYVMTDVDIYETGSPLQTTLHETDLLDVTGNQNASAINGSGFRFMLADGEKFVTNTDIFAGTVLAASYTPDTTLGPCDASGNGALYAFSLSTGRGFFDADPANPSRTLSLGTGVPSSPKASAGPNGEDNRVYIEKSDTSLMSIGTDDIEIGGPNLYWREKNQQ